MAAAAAEVNVTMYRYAWCICMRVKKNISKSKEKTATMKQKTTHNVFQLWPYTRSLRVGNMPHLFGRFVSAFERDVVYTHI